MKVADMLVGNSSAGIHEAPFYHLPVVNIGTRQQRRERGAHVIDATHEKRSILKAVRAALRDMRFRKRARTGVNPYDRGPTAKKVVRILETVKLPSIQKVITY